MSEHIGAEEAQALLDAATPGPWEACTAPHPDDERTPAEWMTSCLNGDGPLWCVTAPNTRGDDLAYLVPAVTGDGPCSEAHAELIAAAPRLAAEVVRLRRELDAARIVATYWRDHMMDGGDLTRFAAHPLAMVLAALDGETDPVQLGVDAESAAARLLGGGE